MERNNPPRPVPTYRGWRFDLQNLVGSFKLGNAGEKNRKAQKSLGPRKSADEKGVCRTCMTPPAGTNPTGHPRKPISQPGQGRSVWQTGSNHFPLGEHSISEPKVPRPNLRASRISRMKICAVMKASPPAVWRSWGSIRKSSHRPSSEKSSKAGLWENAPPSFRLSVRSIVSKDRF